MTAESLQTEGEGFRNRIQAGVIFAAVWILLLGSIDRLPSTMVGLRPCKHGLSTGYLVGKVRSQ